MSRVFEIRAFLPSTLTNSQGSPLYGVDSLFFRVKAETPEEAYSKFIDNPHMLVEITDTAKEGQAVFIRPKSCPAAYVYSVLDENVQSDSQPEDKTQRKVHLKRIK